MILLAPNPPVLAKIHAMLTAKEATRMAQKVLTIGEEEFNDAARLALERCGFLGRRPCRVIAINSNAVGAAGSAH